MASFLVPQKNSSELIQTAFSLVAKSETHRIFDRLLAGAADENITVPVLLLQIDQYQKLRHGSELGLLSQLVEGLAIILIEHTPSEIYVDCINPNEFIVVLPGFSGEQTAQFGDEVVNRFVEFSKKLPLSKRKKYSISGGISVFPEDAHTRIELFQNAREALKEAAKKRNQSLIDQPNLQYLPKEAQLSGHQITQLKTLSKQLSVDDSVLLREAVDDLLLKYL